MADRQACAPVLLREVLLQRRSEAAAPGQPPVLAVRVWAVQTGTGRVFELRGEDAAGNARFSYRDACRLGVLEEFERTVAELLEEYATAPEDRVAHG